MQLYVMSPLFIIALLRRRRLGYGLMTLLACGACFYNFITTFQYDLYDDLLSSPNYINDTDLFISQELSNDSSTQLFMTVGPRGDDVNGTHSLHIGFRNSQTGRIRQQTSLTESFHSSITSVLLRVFNSYDSVISFCFVKRKNRNKVECSCCVSCFISFDFLHVRVFLCDITTNRSSRIKIFSMFFNKKD
ncbi:hypothetical protein TNIN_178321 [Trichonephila inaurata madagascariensis]|uniref:Uncharacterized protein n=1 Tax=Trichonephila inaurata madagascariensis TaxID=2747483 RepID=A0A8X6WXC3_9ARAC|nr:hypothetical protein TNIN_178321 [Trichonephila inaurata madagascariensis]